MSLLAELRKPGFWRRSGAMLLKEFLQLRRDRVTFATMIMLPLMQLILFGYAINTTPRNLPTAVLLQETSDLGRAVLKALENTRYFKVTHQVRDEAEFEDAGRDLRHLLGGVRARVPGVGQQRGDRARLDGARRPWGLGHLHLRDRGLVAGAAGNCATLATWKTGLALGTLRASAPRIRRAQEGTIGSRATVSMEPRCGW